MRPVFYDIESLPNVFTMAVYDPEPGCESVSVYILDDDGLAFDRNSPGTPLEGFIQECGDAIYAANRNFRGAIGFYDLRCEEHAEEMARLFGFTMEGRHTSFPWALTPDTDSSFDPESDYLLLGYNSFNYDTVMLALYFDEAWLPWSKRSVKGQPDVWVNPLTHEESASEPRAVFNRALTAKMMRLHNDNLFERGFRRSMPSYLTRVEDANGNILFSPDGEPRRNWDADENRIRQAMMRSGRYVDVARLNEKQQRVGLKRLLGLIGCQILEADVIGAPADRAELCGLVAYNVSDVVNLSRLYDHPLYRGQAATKRNMLDSYPELVYEFDRGADGRILRDNGGSLAVDRTRIRRNRLYADSSSQQLSSRTLCPDGCLDDKKTVSLIYPCDEKAAEAGIEPFDVLDMAAAFHEDRVVARISDPVRKQEARDAFARVLAAYGSVRGSNFDKGRNYMETYPGSKSKDLKDTPTVCIPYLDAHGEPTSCYVSFSTGGIHGAEYNKALYDADLAAYNRAKSLQDAAKAAFGDGPAGAVAMRNSVARAADPLPIDFPDGEEHFVSEFLKSGFTKSRGEWKPLSEPVLFKTSPKGNMSLNKRYVFTSAGRSVHEDFTSYYPGLLRQMGVFENPDLGYDRYGEIFEGKERFGKIMKDKSLPEVERAAAAAQRENVKLILNSASGGGDAGFDTPILMNNNIIAMRLIGQLFTWYIGQAQTLAGARVPSTNTDGLYTMDLDEDVNNAILAEESAKINVPIEPEPVWLVSKDANNRIEFEVDDDGSTHIVSASGDLACWRGPDPSKSLDHPAIVDRVLADYLVEIVVEGGQNALFEPFDMRRGMRLLQAAAEDGDRTHRLLMFQNVVASAPNVMNYIFAAENDELSGAHALQHYNRVFMLDSDYPDTCRLRIASGTIITPAVANARARKNLRSHVDDPVAMEVLASQSVTSQMLRSANREATVRKLSGVDADCPILVENGSLRDFSDEEADAILSRLGMERYLALVRDAYEDNWRNASAAATGVS